jgi:hypothetical protein
MTHKQRIKHTAKRNSDKAQTFALLMAFIQVIGRGLKAGNKPWTTDAVRQEIESSKIRYGRITKKFLAANLGNMTKSFIAQGKIRRLNTFVTSRYSSDPLPQYKGISHYQDGTFMAGIPSKAPANYKA